MIGLVFLITATTARADVAASFASAHPEDIFLVEIADSGAMRFSNNDGSYVVVLGEQAYSVEAGPGGPRVTTVEAIGYQEAEAIENEKLIPTSFGDNGSGQMRYQPEKDVEILGYKGVRYVVPGTQWTAYTLSKKSSLFPLGKALIAYLQAVEKMSSRDQQEAINLSELLATHGVLGFRQREMVSLSFEPIAPLRFALPATPLTVADLTAGIGDVQSAEKEGIKPAVSIVSADMQDQTLLLLRDDGRMEAWVEGTIRDNPFETPGLVSSFCRARDGIYLATGDKNNKTVTLWRGQPDAWSLVMTLKLNDKNRFLALDCSGAEPLVLTTKSLHFLHSGKTNAVHPNEPWPRGFAKTLQHGGYLYVGVDKGEWGGGMKRFPLAGGAVQPIDGSDPNELCGGLLNTKCDSVTGIAIDPARVDCILATIGLEHMLASGSVVRICDKSISLAYAKPFTVDLGWEFDAENWREPISSVPFYSVTSNGSSAWVVGSDGIYECTDAVVPNFTSFPHNYRFPPSGMDWSNPNFVLISTDMNQRHSLNSGSLIIVPR